MEKSKHTLLFELHYAQRLCTLHSRLFRRIRGTLQMVTLLGTCGAFQSVVAKSPDIAFFSGLALAIVAVVDKVVDPTAHAAAFQEDYKRYTRFLRVARSMEPDKIQAELDLLHVDDEPEIEALRQVAYNDTLEECGLDTREKYKLGWSSRLAAAVA